jgi:hypothetical protein
MHLSVVTVYKRQNLWILLEIMRRNVSNVARLE